MAFSLVLFTNFACIKCKAIYDHSGSRRKSTSPGGPDTYRSDRYIRNDATQTFQAISEESTQKIDKEDVTISLL